MLRRTPVNHVVDQLTDWSVALLERKIPELCQVIDVQELVENRINSFEAEQVEQMILAVSRTHLKWINWFGATLGALMGCLQLILRLFQ